MDPLTIGIAALAAKIFSARSQSNAAKDAARIQSQSADKALAFNRDLYADQRSMVAPYVTGGQTAFNNLMARYGNAGNPIPGYADPNARFGDATSLMHPLVSSSRPRPMGAPATGTAVPRGLSLGQMGSVPNQAGMAQPAPMVTLRAPTGEVKAVPSHLAQQFIARGAVPVNQGLSLAQMGGA